MSRAPLRFWPLIGGFCILFILAAILIARKPVAIPVARAENATAAVKPELATPRAATQTNPTPGSNGLAIATLDRDTAINLDALKDQLFRLELRRQAGTIAEDEYVRERAKAEQILRDLVRG